MIGRAGTLIGTAVGVVLVVAALGLAIFWFSFRVYVPAPRRWNIATVTASVPGREITSQG